METINNNEREKAEEEYGMIKTQKLFVQRLFVQLDKKVFISSLKMITPRTKATSKTS